MYVYPLSIIAGCIAWAAAYSGLPALSLALCVAIVVRCVYRRHEALIVLMFALAYIYAQSRAESALAEQLPLAASNQLFWVNASVISRAGGGTSRVGRQVFVLSHAEVNKYDGESRKLQRIKLASYGDFTLAVNQRCGFYAKLKAPIGTRNPGGHNRERHYLINRISATGHIVQHPDNFCTADLNIGSIATLRWKLSEAIDESELPPAAVAVLKAVSLGDRSELSAVQRDTFKRTGTAHLLAISGLHISLVATFVFLVVRTVALAMLHSRRAITLYRAALTTALVTAAGYAALADFALPTQRALIVVFISSFALASAKQFLSSQTLVWAALLMLLIDPLSALSLSFWMSFSAVAVLVAMHALRGSRSWWRTALYTHLVLSIGTLPLILTISDSLPISAPLANFVAVPVMCLVIIPLTLSGVAMALINLPIYESLWKAASVVFELLWQFLQLVQALFPSPVLTVAPTYLQLVLLATGVLVTLIPLIPHRWVFVGLCLLSIFFEHESTLRQGEFSIVVLDVGQGLSALVATADHLLIYDTGPAFGTYSSGEAVIEPALKKLGYERIDRIMVSHGDNDHAGGLKAILKTREHMS